MNDLKEVLALSYKPTLDEFLAELGLRTKSLSAQLFERVFTDIFSRSKDLRQEYLKYYSVEYQTLKDYLEIAHEVYLSDDDLGKEYILLIRNLSGVVDPNYDDNQLDAVLSCIRKMEVRHES